MKKGILLTNLGTPASDSISDVRRYLREFLHDKRVIDLPAAIRTILVECFILPFRPKKSAHAYQSIWSDDGSPLLRISEKIAQKLQQKLGENYVVSLGMRYGSPTLEQALEPLKDLREITIIPLFPEYSSAATGSAVEATLNKIMSWQIIPELRIIRDFYQHHDFIEAYADQIRQTPASYYLFSYHGLPERQLIKGGCAEICNPVCEPINNANHFCYRAQCYETTRLITQKLGLTESQYTQSFQSRLGKTPWIRPYTDEMLTKLANDGITDLAVVCPSFVADCLETLEEIGIQAQRQWQQLTGQRLKVIPCVNDNDKFIDLLVDLSR
ncbi:ferrochelatase [Legionella quinlivanii]|uniref:Ferrochelatase n=1 Tax=Legionella quinlivanii TaxID=45073 RepID=A0A0W0Y126_9GAMM|nr:ferrochelatase [Legionella quinlivanii]KTD50342.1 ferrochelatase [Legionella quinlivanii]MCW8449911.1 ferrochelatase [Legionella quinlivanii]SEF42989.1 ferrochelatase [Legionella quinlivanii DSM 21216]STY11942.1 ferrochelatase [Legionella quinlivanii]